MNQPVTASVEISSSETMYANIFSASQGLSVGNQRLVYDSTGDTIKVEDSGLWVEGGHLTASNAVSVSGVTTTGADATVYIAKTVSVPADSTLVVLDTPNPFNGCLTEVEIMLMILPYFSVFIPGTSAWAKIWLQTKCIL